MRTAIVSALVTLPFLASPALAECKVEGFRFVAGSEAQTRMVVTSGRSCGVIVHANGLSRFDNIGFTVRPAHGTLSPRSGVGVNYRSAPGYKGEDTFIFSVTGRMASGTTATIRVTVSVI